MWQEELIEMYNEYMDYVRVYLADNTEIDLSGYSDFNPNRVEIIDIKKDLDGGDRYTYYYKISPLKTTYESQVMSFETWERIVLKTKRRVERLRELGI